jgi:anti-sigma B factor antagonist
MPDRFDAVVRVDDGVPIIDLEGEIDGDAEAALLGAYDRAAADANRLVLNFGPTKYINSTGLAVIVQILARARAAGIAIHAFGLNDHYRHIFEITRLVDFVELHADEASSVA